MLKEGIGQWLASAPISLDSITLNYKNVTDATATVVASRASRSYLEYGKG